MLVNAKYILEKAKKENYAIAHFNINNLEWTKFILEECEACKQPVILGVSEGAIRYMGGYHVVSDMVKALDKDLNITIPVVLHLDHGSSFDSCKKAALAGFTSVMIDASSYSLEENIAITKRVVEMAKIYNVTVEAEVGSVGGQEDGVANELAYAKVEDCITFVQKTGIDFLAPALGSVHGLYKGEPKLDFTRMQEIKEKTNLPLVLHGGTGIPDNMIMKSISCGICKVNINTELQIAFSHAVREGLKKDDSVYDPRKIMKMGEESIKNKIKEKLILLSNRKEHN